MFNYDELMSKYIASRRQKIINKNNEMAKHLKISLNMFRPDEIIYELTFKIVMSVERCMDEIYKRPDSTLSFIANLRFLFETCINTRLLALEPSFKYVLRYSIYQQQIKKSKSYSMYAQKDMARLDGLTEEEKLLKKSQKDTTFEKHTKIDELYDNLDEEISIFLDATEYTGADIHKQSIQVYLPLHQKREDGIVEAKNKFIQELLKNKEANSLFMFNGTLDDVERKLNDTKTTKKNKIQNRNWKDKANDVGLSEMYDFIYDYTSGLVHSTAYSLLVPSQLEKAEEDMIIGLGTKIANDILKNLYSFAQIPNVKITQVKGQ